MALSTQTVVSDGTLSFLDLSIKYLDRSEITVLFNSVEVDPPRWGWVGTTDKRIAFTPVVPLGTEVLVKRTTDASELRHYFSLGAAFTAAALDEDLMQVLNIVQEAKESTLVGDFYDNINMHNYTITNLRPGVASTDAATVGQVTSLTTPLVATATAAATTATNAATYARNWATYMAGPVDGTLYSSRWYAEQAATVYQEAVDAVAAITLPIPIDSGGTGGTTPEEARTALELEPTAITPIGTSEGEVVVYGVDGTLNAATLAGPLDGAELYNVPKGVVQDSLDSKFVKVSATGTSHMALALTAGGRVFGWSAGTTGYIIGVGAGCEPTEIKVPGTPRAVDIGCFGSGSAYILYEDGSLYTWGNNARGQLGLGDTVVHQYPKLAYSGVRRVWGPPDVGYPHDHCRLFIQLTSGQVLGAGYNGYGQLGLGDVVDRTVFTLIPALGTTVKELWNLNSMRGVSVAQLESGQVLLCGYNAYGGLGNGTVTPITTFTNAPAEWGSGEVTYCGHASGVYTTGDAPRGLLVMLRGGVLRTCGHNGVGGLGNGTTTDTRTPYTVPGIGTIKHARVLGGTGSVYAINTVGVLYRWGYNGEGQLATGDTVQRTSPYTGVSEPVFEDFAMRGYDLHTYGHRATLFVNTEDTTYSCGFNAYGNAGVASTANLTPLAPVHIPGKLLYVDHMHVNGGGTSVGLSESGDVYVWGYQASTAWTISPIYQVANNPRPIRKFIPT